MIKRITIALSSGIFAVLALFSFVQPPAAYADGCASYTFLGFPNWYRGLSCKDGHVEIASDDGGIPTFVWTIILNATEIVLRVAGILAVIMILVSAFKYLTNGGSEEKIRDAKTSLLQAIVGLAIAMAASAIISYVVGAL